MAETTFAFPAGWEQWSPQERQTWCGRETLKTFRELFDDLELDGRFDFDTWVDAAPLPDTARRAIALARAEDKGGRMNARKAKRQRRQSSVDEATRLVNRHTEIGTCPNCHAEVETFASQFLPGEEGVGFGCARCSPLAAEALAVGRAAREEMHRRN